MSGRRRSLAARATLATLCLVVSGAATAHAFVITEITNFNLTESVSTYGGGTQYHISQDGDGTVSYRWVDNPIKDTVISGNACSDFAVLGSRSIPAGNTNYFTLFTSFAGRCFVLRGRTAAGQGSMNLYDGRLRR